MAKGPSLWLAFHAANMRSNLQAAPFNVLAISLGKGCEGFSNFVGFHGQVLLVGSYRGGFCEKQPEVSYMSSRGNLGQLQDGCATSQGWTI